MTTRRTVLSALVFAATVLPLRSRAQSGVRRIAFLAGRSREDVYYDAFVQGLRDLGYVEGRNITIEWRFAQGDFTRLPALAAELVKLNPEVLVTHATPPSQAAKRATSTIPIVAMSLLDPVGAGLVQSLARSGNNVTGLSNITLDVTPKQVELLKQVIPALARIAVFLNPGNTAHAGVLKSIRGAAQQLGIGVAPIEVRTVAEIERSFRDLAREKPQAIIIASDSFLVTQGPQIIRLALQQRIPAMSPFREHAAAGALMSYGPSITDIYRRGASYVDKILKGAKPSDLPIEQPTTVDLLVNLGTAKTLGITVPQDLRLRAAVLID